MKVCMLTTSFPRQVEDVSGVFIFRLCQALVSNKTTVEVVTPSDQDSAVNEEMQGIQVHRFRYFFSHRWQSLAQGQGGGIPANLNRNPWLFVQLPFFLVMFFIKSLRISKGADVLHANWIYVGLVAWAVQLFRSIPYVVTLRGSDVQRAQKGGFSYFLSLWILKRAAAVTTVNQYLKDWVIAQGIPSQRVTFIRNGVYFSSVRPPHQKHTECRFLFVGSLIPRKGVKYLIEALSQFDFAQTKCTLTIIGEGEEAHSLKKQVNLQNLEEVVTFVGAVSPDDVAHWMARSDCLVLPSLWEGTPNVVLEAMTCGLPVVASDLPGIRELVTSDLNGLLFKAEDVDALFKALSRVMDDQALREKLGENARKRISNLNASWDQTAQRYQECYQKICAVSPDASI